MFFQTVEKHIKTVFQHRLPKTTLYKENVFLTCVFSSKKQRTCYFSKVAMQSKSFGRKGKNLARDDDVDDDVNGDAGDGRREGIVVFVVVLVDVKKFGFGFAIHTHSR